MSLPYITYGHLASESEDAIPAQNVLNFTRELDPKRHTVLRIIRPAIIETEAPDQDCR